MINGLVQNLTNEMAGLGGVSVFLVEGLGRVVGVCLSSNNYVIYSYVSRDLCVTISTFVVQDISVPLTITTVIFLYEIITIQ